MVLIPLGPQLLDFVCRQSPFRCGARNLGSYFGEGNQMLDFDDIFFRSPQTLSSFQSQSCFVQSHRGAPGHTGVLAGSFIRVARPL